MRGGKEAEYVHIVKEDLKLSLLINAEIVCVKRLFKWTTLSPNPGISNGEWKGHRIWDQTKIWNQIYNSISSWEGVFPDSSVGKESTCHAGNPGSIPGLGRSAGEGIGYPLQYSWTSLVAQLVKNPPAMQETWYWSLGWEDPMEKGKATHWSILAWRIPWTI